MKTQRYYVRNSSLFDSRGYRADDLRRWLGGALVNPRKRRSRPNQPPVLTFALSEGFSPTYVATRLAAFLGRTPFIDPIEEL
jgi:hypothetical protein